MWFYKCIKFRYILNLNNDRFFLSYNRIEIGGEIDDEGAAADGGAADDEGFAANGDEKLNDDCFLIHSLKNVCLMNYQRKKDMNSSNVPRKYMNYLKSS